MQRQRAAREVERAWLPPSHCSLPPSVTTAFQVSSQTYAAARASTNMYTLCRYIPAFDVTHPTTSSR